MTDIAVEFDTVTCIFGQKVAVRDLSLRIPVGSTFALVGRNGAGKSTTIRTLLGLIEPTRGASKLLGADSQRLPPEVRARVGYLAEGHPVHRRMTVQEHAGFQARYHAKWHEKTFRAILEAFSIDERAKAIHLSRGQRAIVCLGLTLATRPDLLVLDDPMMGLDPIARRAFLEALVHFSRGEGRTVLFSSHLLADVERVADYLGVLDGGSLRACCTIDTFQKQVRKYILHFDGKPPGLSLFPGLVGVAVRPSELHATVVSNGDTLPPPLRALHPRAVEELPMGLEDSLLAYIGDASVGHFLLHEPHDQEVAS
ncbi:ABC transporter ATP-binding protein [Pendulispora rubella]|uniref:ABC transporter ATP-binding protein n=1 Tax=Pendulispora rubella TaxID=2741070 RepID=A0ABZ2KVS2_9BACT